MAQNIEGERDSAVALAPLRTERSAPLRMSFDEFLLADFETGAEWVDGEVIPMSPPTNKHQELVLFLAALMRFLAEARDAGEVIIAPFAMKIDERRGCEPDIMFVAKEHLDRLRSSHLAGAADIVVEIISPESQTRDRGDKFYEYERAGVGEYWMIDRTRKRAEFYSLDESGTYEVVLAEGGVFRSRILEGFWLSVEWLWHDPLPPLVSVLREWKLI